MSATKQWQIDELRKQVLALEAKIRTHRDERQLISEVLFQTGDVDASLAQILAKITHLQITQPGDTQDGILAHMRNENEWLRRAVIALTGDARKLDQVRTMMMGDNMRNGSF